MTKSTHFKLINEIADSSNLISLFNKTWKSESTSASTLIISFLIPYNSSFLTALAGWLKSVYLKMLVSFKLWWLWLIICNVFIMTQSSAQVDRPLVIANLYGSPFSSWYSNTRLWWINWCSTNFLFDLVDDWYFRVRIILAVGLTKHLEVIHIHL